MIAQDFGALADAAVAAKREFDRLLAEYEALEIVKDAAWDHWQKTVKDLNDAVIALVKQKLSQPNTSEKSKD